ncbi:MAG: autotransporter-associated beta strand repeat-containing protein [Pirellulales bacterium]
MADAATTLTVSGNMSGTADLTKAGLGTLTISGTNSNTGTTTVAAGILQAGAATGLNATSTHIVEAGGTLRLNNFAVTIGGLSGAGTVEIGPSATAARC